ncbi:MAG TPA: nucleotidyltransferase family protein, partial [Kofleriaceae bacterium]|nr:nucleotidyltransferase family protein [Kofleriaceae bacterium]
MTDADRRALRRLVARLVRTAGGEAVAAGPPGEVSATLAAAVRRHMLGPLAHAEGWPGFRGDHAAAAIHADRRAAVAAEAVEALGGAGIAVMLIKGMAYAGTVYADPALRPMSDIDLMVSATRYRDAIDVLGRLGYWHAGTPDQLSGPNHGYTLKRKDGSIDVHR